MPLTTRAAKNTFYQGTPFTAYAVAVCTAMTATTCKQGKGGQSLRNKTIWPQQSSTRGTLLWWETPERGQRAGLMP